MPSPADREKALESALAQIDRQFGKGSVMRLGSDERAPVEVVPTGSLPRSEGKYKRVYDLRDK